MAQCPNCHSEVKADERFCGNCGARITPSIPPPATPPPVNQPPRPTGKETIVLPKITDLAMHPPAPPADATIIAAPAPISQPPVTPSPTPQPPVAPTMIGSAPGTLPPSPQPAPPYTGG